MVPCELMLATLDDGRRVAGWFAYDDLGRRLMKEQGYRIGDRGRFFLKQIRDLMRWRFAHVLGTWLADNHEMFTGMTAHDALKHLQFKSRIGCDVLRWKLEGFTATVYTPKSLNFTTMKEQEFRGYWDGGAEGRGQGGWIGWIRDELYDGMDNATIEEVEFMITGERATWRE